MQSVGGVPTIADRAWQCLAKYALEPAHEATFHERSYGFRTGRSAHDAQKTIFNNLRSQSNGIRKRILELDIEKCFDRISHNCIMESLIAPSRLKLGIFRCLKAGTNVGFPAQGTPQGGVVSPLLANIALNGIERIGEYKQSGKITSKCVRYADDMTFFLKPEDDAQEILEKISEFLKARGMKVSEKKTKLTKSTEGFDFLGWNFRVQKNGKFRCTPSVENFKTFRKKVKQIVNCSNYGSTEKAKKLAPIVRGWRNYHKFGKMKGARNSLYYIQKRAYNSLYARLNVIRKDYVFFPWAYCLQWRLRSRQRNKFDHKGRSPESKFIEHLYLAESAGFCSSFVLCLDETMSKK